VPPTYRIERRPYDAFEWDPVKSDECFARRGFDFGFAAKVFEGEILRRRDARHANEDRFQAIGEAGAATLFVVYTVRNRRCRIISAREATAEEARLYHGC
jgi:uncharacterized DUF497 family protein